LEITDENNHNVDIVLKHNAKQKLTKINSNYWIGYTIKRNLYNKKDQL